MDESDTNGTFDFCFFFIQSLLPFNRFEFCPKCVLQCNDLAAVLEKSLWLFNCHSWIAKSPVKDSLCWVGISEAQEGKKGLYSGFPLHRLAFRLSENEASVNKQYILMNWQRCSETASAHSLDLFWTTNKLRTNVFQLSDDVVVHSVLMFI